MAFEKPMSQNQKDLGNQLYKFMMKNGTVTKDQMLVELGWDKSKDRQIRDLLSMIAKKVPVISTSDKKGYKIAKTQADLDEVTHTWKELDSRIDELNARKEPLIKFYENIKKEVINYE